VRLRLWCTTEQEIEQALGGGGSRREHDGHGRSRCDKRQAARFALKN